MRIWFSALLRFSGLLMAVWLPQAGTSASRVQPPDVAASATIRGSVLDEDGAAVPGAAVTLTNINSGETRVTKSDSAGTYSFSVLSSDDYTLTVAAQGFAPFRNPRIALSSDETLQLPDITLHLAAVSSNMDVTASRREVAEAQIQSEVKQRLLGVLPNYYVVYYKDPAPLNARQKMRLALRLAIDPVNFGIAAVQAASETNNKNYEEYGTGAEGFSKRYAAAYADGFIGTMVGSGLIHAVFRQDPRYYYKGTGTIRARALYALSWSFRCKGDNGKWQINYSALAGDIASDSISKLYYPKAISNSAAEMVKYSFLNLASQGVDALFQEFLFKHVTTHANEPGKGR